MRNENMMENPRQFARNARFAAIVAVALLLVLGIIVLPLAYIATALVQESISAYASLSSIVVERGPVLFDQLLSATGLTASQLVTNFGLTVKDYVVGAAPVVISSVAGAIVGLFIMFFVMYFAFTEGER